MDIAKFKADAKDWFRASIRPYLKNIKRDLLVTTEGVKAKSLSYDIDKDKITLELNNGEKIEMSAGILSKWTDGIKIDYDRKLLIWTEHDAADAKLKFIDAERIINPDVWSATYTMKDLDNIEVPKGKAFYPDFKIKSVDNSDGEYDGNCHFTVKEDGYYTIDMACQFEEAIHNAGTRFHIATRFGNKMYYLQEINFHQKSTKKVLVTLQGSFTSYASAGTVIKGEILQNSKDPLRLKNNGYPWSKNYISLTKVG
jgi:hypothetical protein